MLADFTKRDAQSPCSSGAPGGLAWHDRSDGADEVIARTEELVNTHSHAFFTFAALHNVEGAGLAVAGSVFPDVLYYMAVPAIALRRGISYRQAQTEVYRIPALRRLVDAI